MEYLEEDKKGFTLIEILIVIMLIAVLATGAVFSGTYLFASIGLNSTVHNVTTALETARDYTLDKYNGQSNYGVEFTSSKIIIYSGTTYSASSPVVDTINVSAGVTLTNINFNSLSYIYFQSVTGAASNTGSLKANAQTSSHTISINTNGIATIQ